MPSLLHYFPSSSRLSYLYYPAFTNLLPLVPRFIHSPFSPLHFLLYNLLSLLPCILFYDPTPACHLQILPPRYFFSFITSLLPTLPCFHSLPLYSTFLFLDVLLPLLIYPSLSQPAHTYRLTVSSIRHCFPSFIYLILPPLPCFYSLTSFPPSSCLLSLLPSLMSPLLLSPFYHTFIFSLHTLLGLPLLLSLSFNLLPYIISHCPFPAPTNSLFHFAYSTSTTLLPLVDSLSYFLSRTSPLLIFTFYCITYLPFSLCFFSL